MATSTTTDRSDATKSTDATVKSLSKPTNKGGSRRAPMTSEQQDLAMKYLPMAKSLAKPLKLNWPIEGQEFDSAAMLALVEAAQSFDPTRNVKFGTFARYRIWGALRDVQRSLIANGFRSDLDNAPNLSSLAYDSEELGLIVGSDPDGPVGEEFEAVEFVESWLKKLPPKHAEACRQIYIHDKSQFEASESPRLLQIASLLPAQGVSRTTQRRLGLQVPHQPRSLRAPP